MAGIEQHEADVMDMEVEEGQGQFFKKSFFQHGARKVRAVPLRAPACGAPAAEWRVPVQNGAYYTCVHPDGSLSLKEMNYPKTGDTEHLFGLQLGGFCCTIEADAGGVQWLTNFKDLLVGPEPKSLSCKAGTLVLSGGNMKMYGKPGAAWGLVQGPAVASTVPIHQETDGLKAGQGKKLSPASKEIIMKLPGDGTVKGYVGRHQGENIVKMDATSLFEVGSDGNSLEGLSEGQENLLKLLKVPGVKLSLALSKKIPARPKGASLNIFAQHPDINDGEVIMLFASAPVAGPPPHILQKGMIPGGHSLKELMELPWLHELREVIDQVVKPLVDFAVHFDTCVAASIWKKDVTTGIPRSIVDLVQTLARLYKSHDKERVERLLSFVTSSVAEKVGGEWRSSGLLIDSKASTFMKGKTRKAEESDEDESDGDESDEDGKKKAKKAKKAKGKSSFDKRPHASPAKSSSGSSSGSSGAKKRRVAEATVGFLAPDESDEEKQLGDYSDEE